MFAPGAGALVKEFNVTSNTLAAFTVTIYVLGFSLGPLVLAPLSELYGRLIIYHFCNAFYFAFTLGCALSKDITMFLIFRFICGCAASAPMTIGGGTVADVVPQEKRGKAMALFAIGPLLGPVRVIPFASYCVVTTDINGQVIGPVIGGFVSQGIGWRWTFWLIAILVSLKLRVSIFIPRVFLTTQ